MRLNLFLACLILSILPGTIASANHYGLGFSLVSASLSADSSNIRTWSDGSMAKSCKEYRQPSNRKYRYSGATGNGYYKIKNADYPSGASVYCDMELDGGGWTLLFTSSKNVNYNTSDSQIISQTLETEATEGLTYFASNSSNFSYNISTRYKFVKPYGFDLWNAYSTLTSSVTKIDNGAVANLSLVYGRATFSSKTCDSWVTSVAWGRFGACLSGASSDFNEFPFYTGYTVSNEDDCAFSSQVYNVTACGSNRFLVLFFR